MGTANRYSEEVRARAARMAALTRKKDESILDLLVRLDRAVRKAAEEEQFTDEINS
jgi:hypothetical protein